MNLKNVSSIILNISLKVVIYMVLIGILYFCGNRAYEFGREVFSESGVEAAPGRDVTITVPEGTTNRQLAQILKKDGLIDNVYIFYIQAYLYECKPVAGEYLLNTSYSAEKLIEVVSTVPKQEKKETEKETKKEKETKAKKTKKE